MNHQGRHREHVSPTGLVREHDPPESDFIKEDIEKMFPPLDQSGNMTHQNQSLEIIENETFEEEESFVF
jgi:hypothetical protein